MSKVEIVWIVAALAFGIPLFALFMATCPDSLFAPLPNLRGGYQPRSGLDRGTPPKGGSAVHRPVNDLFVNVCHYCMRNFSTRLARSANPEKCTVCFNRPSFQERAVDRAWEANRS